MANIMLRKEAEAEVKLSQIPLSNDTISDRIEDMSKDILAQVVADLLSSPAKFSLQLDETTDVSNLSQLAVFIVVECVNYVRTSALRHRIFSELCKEMGSEFEVLLYHSNVRWLSRGQVLNRVFAVRVELALFLQEHQHCHADCFKNSEFILILAYMADIFAALNHLNQKMQGGGVNIIDDCVSKIEDVSGIGDISLSAELKQAIATHLDELAKSLDGYFPTRESYPAWVRQPFTFSVETTDVNDEYLDEIIEIQQSQVQQQLFRTTTLSTFWCQQMVTYPVIAKKALEIFKPFVTTYLASNPFRGCWT
ncbi:unnamed protein product [Oncorhynchus mykiss]|uniref:DUF4371 domain-containing protein n=1 Tax=Oncorhynchus mykiss TaxID=8022 RepID=A0A060YE54_ONCMY|nr:unnamed protein product [Oncorhynchus mykiss]